MNWRLIIVRCCSLLVVGSTTSLFGAPALETSNHRLAIGPFFAPENDKQLRQAAQILPELLAVEISGSPRFQIVERDKVHHVWDELNLSAASLVSREHVAKFGHVTACDWLVSGSFVQAEGRSYVWTRIIDVRQGVVRDLNVTPFTDGAVTNVVRNIATFLGQSSSRVAVREFITLGRFVDMNVPGGPKREDWSRRLAVLIEKHAIESGYGVAEMAAVGPIFEERRLEVAGLTGNPEGRVNVQPAFCLVDGGCEWVNDAAQLAVGLRVQRAGALPQLFWFTNAPGAAVERDLIATLTKALANTRSSSKAGTNPEADLLAERGRELAEMRSPFRSQQPSRRGTGSQWEEHKKLRDQQEGRHANRAALLANYQKLLLQDPGNLNAKLMLGTGWLGDPEPAKREQGKALLRDVAASKEPRLAASAKMALTNAAMFAEIGDRMREGPQRPKDLDSLNRANQENPSDLEVKCDLGAALIAIPRTSDRVRGRKMLAEVAAGDRPGLADRARKLLAEPEKGPPVLDQVDRDRAAVEAARRKQLVDKSPEALALDEFLQKNFERFIPVRLERDGAGFARIQRLPVQENKFTYEDNFFCGFRFVMPEWADGDLTWMNILAKTEAQKDFVAENFTFYIVPRTGQMPGFERPQRLETKKYARLKEKFPHTQGFYCQYMPRDRFEPGKEYGIWFRFGESDLPDIAFALTISSDRGRMEIGELPVH